MEKSRKIEDKEKKTKTKNFKAKKKQRKFLETQVKGKANGFRPLFIPNEDTC